MAGPEETRLAQGLTGSMPLTVGARAGEWSECAQILLDVATQLGNVSMPIPPGEAGAETATAMNTAFARSADAMRKRAAKLQQGNAALDDSSQVIEQAKAAFEALGPENAAPTHTPHEDPSSPAGIRAENKYNSELAAFHADQERRERISKTHADRMDQVFQRSAATMKEIHGEPDPPPPPPAYSGGGGGVGGGAGFGSGGGHAPGSGGPRTLHPVGTYEPGPGGHGPGHPGTGGGYVPTPGIGGPQGGTTVDYIPGASQVSSGPSSGGLHASAGLGAAGAVAGGLGGGMLASGMAAGGIRGGLGSIVANPGTAASGVRGIGSTGRSGVSGALGRSGATPVAPSSGAPASRGAAGRGVSGRAGAGAGAGGTAAGRNAAGGRGGAGGRGAGGRGAAGAGTGAAGRTGRTKDDEKGRKRDLFDAGEDWVDDEDAAPGVIE